MPFVQVRKYTFPTWGKYGKLRYEILSRALTQYQGYMGVPSMGVFL